MLLRRGTRAWRSLAASLAVLASGFVGNVAAQGTGTTAVRGLAVDSDVPVAKKGHRYVLAIGVNDYLNWPKLDTAVNDATGFAQLLQTQYGYELAAPPLTEKQVTLRAIDNLIDDDLPRRLKLEDDLVLFFAGHGTAQPGPTENRQKVAFLVPYDAHGPGADERWGDYVDLSHFLERVSRLPARHILVILDSCRSGGAISGPLSSLTPVQPLGEEHLIYDLSRKVGRKVIVSAEDDQPAADHGGLRGHSLFTGLLIQALMDGKAASFGQGFVTSMQLGTYVQYKVSVAPGSRQTPSVGAFYGDDGGDLILTKTANGDTAP